jgi:hypothetical protein
MRKSTLSIRRSIRKFSACSRSKPLPVTDLLLLHRHVFAAVFVGGLGGSWTFDHVDIPP